MKGQIAKDFRSSSHVNKVVKAVFMTLAIGLVGLSLPILVIGTYGCYKPFVLQSPFDLASSDPVRVQDATANYANAGHALEYLAVGAILSLKVVQYILGGSYRRVRTQQIQACYENALANSNADQALQDLFYQRMKQEI